MKKNDIVYNLCEELVKLENFKYSYKELIEYVENIKKENKKVKKIEKKEIELENYQNFMNRQLKEGKNINECLESWYKYNKIDFKNN